MKYLKEPIMKRRKLYITLSISLFIVLYIFVYVSMLVSVKDTLRTIYLHPEQDGQIEGTYVEPKIMNKFFRQEIYPSSSNDRIDFSLSTGKVLHFFFIGNVWITYKYEGIDKVTNKPIYGSHATMTLTVKFSKGKWKIINKYERP
jgi:hypothetical protein